MDNVHTAHTHHSHHNPLPVTLQVPHTICPTHPPTCLQHGDVATGMSHIHLTLQYPQTRMVEEVIVWNGDLFIPVKGEWNVLHMSILTPAMDLPQQHGYMYLVGVVSLSPLPVSELLSESGHRSLSGGGWRRTLTWGHDPNWLLGHDGNPGNKRG